MKKVIMIFFIIFSICNQSYSQDHWVINTEIGGNLHTGTMCDIEFIDDKNGWAVGFTDYPTHSKIIKTIDGGVTWKNIEIPYTKPLRRVEFVSTHIGWAVGDSGIVLKTLDGGETWKDISINPLHHLFCMSAVDQNIVYISGDSGMFRTFDGGAIWHRMTYLNTPNVQFIDKDYGNYISNPLHLMQTTDGGTSFVDKGPQLGIFFLNYLNRSTGWLFGWDDFGIGVIKKTTDGSNTFTTQYNLGTSMITKSAIIDENNVLAIGERGAIYRTDDGGINWERRNTTYSDFTDIAFNNQNNGFIVGTYGIFLQTVTRGESWFEKYVSPGFYVYNVKYNKYNRLRAAFTSENSIFLSNDGGLNWKKKKMDDDSYWGLAYLNDNSILVSGKYGVKKSIDGGQTWTTKYHSPSNALIYKMYFIDDQLGWAVGENGLLIKTMNGGETWLKIDIGTTNFINSIFFINSNHGYLVGDNVAYRTFDGGNNWILMNGFTTTYHQDVHFINEKTGWIVGEQGTIYKTNDEGATWTKSQLPIHKYIYGIYFVSETEGWLYGEQGLLFYTNNGGNTWKDKSLVNKEAILSIDFNIQNQGILGSSSGAIRNYQCQVVAPTAPEAQFFVKGQHVSNLTVTGSNLQWYLDSTLLRPTALTDELFPQSYYVTSSNGNCISNPIKVVASLKNYSAISNPTSSDSFNKGCKTKFFYSSAEKELHINISQTKNNSINLYTIEGQLILSQVLKEKEVIDLKYLTPGIYIAKLDNCDEGLEFIVE